MSHAPLLAAEHVDFSYAKRQVLHDVSLTVASGGSVGIVGESGSGKSTLLSLLLGLSSPQRGTVSFTGEVLRVRDRAQLRHFRSQVQAVFQDPYASLDPRQRIGQIIAEPLESLDIARGEAAQSRVAEALTAVGLDPEVASRYPHQFSGGQRQRIAIARAVVVHPRILIADEPVSALDLGTRSQVIALLNELRESTGLALVMVSHDMGTVAATCEHTAVMEHGRIVEQGPTQRIVHAPVEPYTQRLMAAIPRLPQS